MTTNILRRSAWVVLFGLLWAILSPARGDDKPADKAEPKKPVVKVISVTIHPAAAPVPALKYHLLPTFVEQTPGNAVPLYANVLVGYLWFRLRSPEDDPDLAMTKKWLETPLDALPRDRVKKYADFGGLRSLKEAVRRERCDWDPPLREGRAWEVILPQMSQLCEMSRLLVLRARLQIAEGKYAEAIESVQIGYSMARQIAEYAAPVTAVMGRTIIEGMNDQLLALCQQPGAPNLYWSLAELPSPVINLEKSLKVEYEGSYLEWPELQNLRTAKNAPEQWDVILRRTVSEAVRYQYFSVGGKPPEKDKVSLILARAIAAASAAKADLIAAGYSRENVESMPPSQIVLLHTLEMYDRLRDEQYKWLRLPYWQAQAGLAAFERDCESAKKRELIPLTSSFIPDRRLGLAMFGFARAERQLAALRSIEALRLYAAGHAGKLPVSLSDVKEAPIPINPVTGRAFPYRLEGETAVLDADGGPDNVEHSRTQYRITVAK
jgi:hypothetical protein